MAKNAAKKRRRGTPKVSREQKNTFHFRKPNFKSEVVKGVWDNKLAADVNMARIGLKSDANADIRPLALAAVKAAPGGQLAKDSEVATLFDNSSDLREICPKELSKKVERALCFLDGGWREVRLSLLCRSKADQVKNFAAKGVPNTSDLGVVDRNLVRRPLSPEDQRYTLALMKRFGLNFEAMALDTKVNYNQLTLGQVRRMCKTLLSLKDEHRVVDVPEDVQEQARTA